MDILDELDEEAARKRASGPRFQPKARPGPKKGPSVPRPSVTTAQGQLVAPKPLESGASVDDSSNVPGNSYAGFSNIDKQEKLSISGKSQHSEDPGYGCENAEIVAREQDNVVGVSSNVPQSHMSGNLTAGISPLGVHEENLSGLLPALRVPVEPIPGFSSESDMSLHSCSNVAGREVMSLSSDRPTSLTSTDVATEKVPCPPVHNLMESSHFMEAEVFPGLEALEGFPEATVSSRGKFVPKPKARSGEKQPDPGISQATFTDDNHRLDPMIDFESECIHDGTEYNPEQFYQYSSARCEESDMGDPVPQPLDDDASNNYLEPSHFEASVSEYAEHAQRNHDNLGNSAEKSTRQLRKRVTVPHLMDESSGDAQDDIFSPEMYSGMDGEGEDDEIEGQENLQEKKKPTRKSSKSQDGQPSQKRKRAEESSTLSKEGPKKKFTHTTRRSRRCVDKALLQIHEDEIVPQRLKIVDLIRLAEHKEREAKNQLKPLKKTSNGESGEKSLDKTIGSEECGTSSAQPCQDVEPEKTFFNYQSFMEKTPRVKWSKQDTELFYEGIRQFGTDFSMIKELFPHLTRHQVKLKYKNEQRHNRMRLSEAEASRAKDYRHFEFVIARLQSAAQAEKQSRLDNSEDGSEDLITETNETDDATTKKPEKDEEGGNADPEGDNGEFQSSLKSVGNGEEKEEDDDEDEDDFYTSKY